jgi:hypothetical protein
MRNGKLHSRVETLETINTPKGGTRFVLMPRDVEEAERESILSLARADHPSDTLQIIPCESIELLF